MKTIAEQVDAAIAGALERGSVTLYPPDDGRSWGALCLELASRCKDSSSSPIHTSYQGTVNGQTWRIVVSQPFE